MVDMKVHDSCSDIRNDEKQTKVELSVSAGNLKLVADEMKRSGRLRSQIYTPWQKVLGADSLPKKTQMYTI